MHPVVAAIRPARPLEATALTALALRSKAHWGYDAEFMDACVEELTVTAEEIETGHVFLGELEGSVVGFHAISHVDGDAMELDYLFVEPAHIGRGVGRALMAHAKATAAALGARRLVVQGDPHAAGFYLAAGGEPAGERDSASVPGRRLPVFVVSLT